MGGAREKTLSLGALRGYAERGLPELITVDFADYEALALRLARNDAYRAAIRKTLGQTGTAPLSLRRTSFGAIWNGPIAS
jgi:hypothetical protein